MFGTCARVAVTAGVVLATLCLPGCAKAPSKPAGGGTTSDAAAKRRDTPLTDEECRQFAERLEEQIESQGAAALEQVFDRRQMAEKVAATLDVPAKERAAFVAGMLGASPFSKVISAELEAGGLLRLLRVHRVEGVPRALFRFTSEVKFNYYDFVLERSAAGGVQINDMYIFAAGDFLTQVLSRTATDLMHRRGENADEEKQRLTEFTQSMHKIQAALREDRAQEALDLFDGLPASLRNSKPLMVIRLSICSHLSAEVFERAMQDFSAAYPDDPAVEFFAADLYASNGENVAAIQAIERLQSKLGGDPYLDVRRAELLFELSRDEEAEQAVDKALEEEPDLLDAYWLLLDVSLKEQEFERTADLLIILEEDLGVELRDLQTLPEYAEFVKSPEYRHWQRQRAAKAADDSDPNDKALSEPAQDRV